MCENSDGLLDLEKMTSTFSIWRVFLRAEGSEKHFFVPRKDHFGVFTQPLKPGLHTLCQSAGTPYGSGSSRLDDLGINFFGINTQLLDRFRDHALVQFALFRQRMERGDDRRFRVHFEEPAQPLARIA